jgi:hypothetical protein
MVHGYKEGSVQAWHVVVVMQQKNVTHGGMKGEHEEE